MENKTLFLLEDSLLVWREKLVKLDNKENLQFGINSCPLCKEFYDRNPYCGGCPILKKVKVAFCEKTPYHAVINTFNKWKSMKTPHNEKVLRINIQKEIDFLISLCP